MLFKCYVPSLDSPIFKLGPSHRDGSLFRRKLAQEFQLEDVNELCQSPSAIFFDKYRPGPFLIRRNLNLVSNEFISV